MSEKDRPEGFLEQIGLRKLGNPDGFRFFQWEALGARYAPPGAQDVLLTGCVVTKFKERGKNKGAAIYDGPRRKVVVAESEVIAAKKEYEEAGGCAECQRTGEVVAGWSVDDGTRYRQCARCGGSGVAPSALPVHSTEE